MARNSKVLVSTKETKEDVVILMKNSGYTATPAKLPEPSKLVAMDAEAADRNIKLIGTSGKKLKELVHATACGILLHYVATGDYTRLIRLYAAVQESMGAQMAGKLATWVETYSTVKTNDKTGSAFAFIDSVKGMGMNAKKFDVSALDPEGKPVGAAHVPFWNVKSPEGPATKYNALELFSKLFERLQSLLKANVEKKAKHGVTPDIIEDFKAFLLEHSITFDKEGKPQLPAPKVTRAIATRKTAVAKTTRKPRAKKIPAEAQDGAVH